MNIQSNRKPVEQIVAAIEALDLEPIKFKLMDPEEGQGWSRQYVEKMAIAYKRFLTLLVTHPESTVAPSKDIDKFWHGHILDTMKYAEDCERVFGYFLHHFPYFGMRGEEDAVALANAGQEMQRLYAQEFGEAMPVAAEQAKGAAFCMAAVKSATNAAFCMAAVKPVTNAAFCMAAVKPVQDAAFCMAAVKPAQDAAF
jgi:hypothetical protein